MKLRFIFDHQKEYHHVYAHEYFFSWIFSCLLPNSSDYFSYLIKLRYLNYFDLHSFLLIFVKGLQSLLCEPSSTVQNCNTNIFGLVLLQFTEFLCKMQHQGCFATALGSVNLADTIGLKNLVKWRNCTISADCHLARPLALNRHILKGHPVELVGDIILDLVVLAGEALDGLPLVLVVGPQLGQQLDRLLQGFDFLGRQRVFQLLGQYDNLHRSLFTGSSFMGFGAFLGNRSKLEYLFYYNFVQIHSHVVIYNFAKFGLLSSAGNNFKPCPTKYPLIIYSNGTRSSSTTSLNN